MKVILFDGVCNLCNSTVRFVINKDSKNIFKFASLQSLFGAKYIKKHNINVQNLSTIVLIENDQFYTRSTAILKIFKSLKGYKWTVIFFYIPQFIRDFFYDIISRNRFLLFGRKNSCMIPSKELLDKFIEF